MNLGESSLRLSELLAGSLDAPTQPVIALARAIHSLRREAELLGVQRQVGPQSKAVTKP